MLRSLAVDIKNIKKIFTKEDTTLVPNWNND